MHDYNGYRKVGEVVDDGRVFKESYVRVGPVVDRSLDGVVGDTPQVYVALVST